ncbi:MAG: hydantoinase/carbamoylase family amidase [Bacillota bacterium]|nr:hydantoinase/carbamoylase family amidase [Bacillota bacterium]
MKEAGSVISKLYALGAIGFSEGVGTSRVAYTEPFFEGRKYTESLMKEAGLVTRIDSVGNLFGMYPGKSNKKILIGSHLDTVPGGGMYDGALGVLGGIECVGRLIREGCRFNHTIEIVGFIEEEGNAVGGTFGSRCFAGVPFGEKEVAAMVKYGVTPDDASNAKCNPDDYLCYIELHIEQGGLLESRNTSVGIAEGIVGIIRYAAAVKGESNHAGSTPMSLRSDAMMKSCDIIRQLAELVKQADESMVCTVGDFHIPGGAVNVIPGRTEFPIELRYKNVPDMEKVIDKLKRRYPESDMELNQFLNQKETVLDPKISNTVEKICERQNISSVRMFSGAGHDAINTAFIMPSALIFIPSVGGISHSIREYSRPEDIETGISVLCELIKDLDKGEQL